ncbi:MAG: calcium/sodium antiporter [Bauldia sp.]|nr:calcium/sodium antiporter [Bauldia sp.]
MPSRIAPAIGDRLTLSSILQILGGLVLLAAGGEFLVRGSVRLAERLGLSPLIIGIVLVGFGTSAPELVTSVTAALDGSPGIAIGNVVGSNITNLLLVLGAAAIFGPLAIDPRSFRRDGIAMAAATILLVVLVATADTIGRLAGATGLILLVAYLVFAARSERSHQGIQAEAPSGPPIAVLLIVPVAGLAAVLFGADLLVDGAGTIARALGVSEAVIGLSIVAIGTSLPELATATAAIIRRQPELAIGNVIGSCIFNVLGILGITALIQPLAVPAEIAAYDIWVLLAATIVACLLAITGWRVTRWEGVLLLSAFALYLTTLAVPSLRELLT